MSGTGVFDVTAILSRGVYLLYRDNIIVYVGQSKCMLVRIYTHRSLARKRVPSWIKLRGVVFDRCEVIPCHPDRIDALERALIELHKPVYNKSMNPEPAALPIPLLAALKPKPKPAPYIFTARL